MKIKFLSHSVFNKIEASKWLESLADVFKSQHANRSFVWKLELPEQKWEFCFWYYGKRSYEEVV